MSLTDGVVKVLAIDPGNTETGWVLIDADTRKPLQIGKSPNHMVLERCWSGGYDHIAIEMVASYGMAVGAEVFDTCVWIGRYLEAATAVCGVDGLAKPAPQLVKRNPVKVHHCHASNAKDSNIIQALVDRFAYGQPNRGKGTKVSPGWFHGFHDDIWQAYALAVYVADTLPRARLIEDVRVAGGLL